MDSEFEPHVSDGKDLLMWPPAVGRKFRMSPKAPYHKNGCPCEIRGVVDDRVIFRWWKRSKNSWVYEIEGKFFFEIRGLLAPESRIGFLDRSNVHIKEFSRENVDAAPSEPGVFTLFGSRDIVNFVSSALDIRKELLDHLDKGYVSAKSFSCEIIEDEDRRQERCTSLMLEHKPYYNYWRYPRPLL